MNNEPQLVLYDKDAIAWAINVGGSEYQGIDGVRYEADQYITGGIKGELEKVLGTQDSEVYKSYRSGDLKLRRPIPNGTYSISFQFTEPEDIDAGTRVFDVLAQGKKVIAALDVRLARDGRHLSALERTVTDVVVSNGQLEIDFIAKTHKPVLSGIVVRETSPDHRRWELSWVDEFDYEGAPDPDKWNIDIWEAGKVNSEDQAYTDRNKNVRVSGGKLILEAHREDYDKASYTSARIQSQGKRDVLYGRIDVRARLPQGQGTWPAIWLLPSDPFRYATSCSPGEEWQGSSTCDAWPNSGEIDIMEHVGYDMGRVHGTVHNIAYYWANSEQRKGSVEVRDVDKAFHVYSLVWTPTEIHMSVDGTHYFSYFNESNGWQSWPYDHPYHLILNVAVGGMWGKAGGPIDDNVFPTRMEVDYVRVFSDPRAN
ncbi:MAG: family 16 glycosylhydrolase [Halioglobus sp.]